METEARILIIEDQREYGKPVYDVLSKSLAKTPLGALVKKASVDWAKDANRATKLLRGAAASLHPYDLVLLDLELPWREKDKQRHTQIGFNLLRTEIPAGDRESVLIFTTFGQDPNVQRALSFGAYSFVVKRQESLDDKLLTEVIRTLAFAYRHVITSRANAWLQFKEQHRERWAVAQRERQVADRFSQVVSDGMSTVLFKAQELAELLVRDYDVNVDTEPQHPIARLLNGVCNAATMTASRCSASRDPMTSPVAPREKVRLQDLIGGVLDELRPGFVHRRLQLDFQPLAARGIYSLPGELRAVLREMIFNIIDEATPGQSVSIAIRQIRGGKWQEVTVATRVDSEAQTSGSDRLGWQGAAPEAAVGLTRMLARNFGGGISVAGDGRRVRKVVLNVPDLGGRDENGSPR